MEPDRRRGVSTYLEAFVLIGVALAGSSVVAGAVGRYSESVQGPGVTVTGATIRQGSGFAIERLTVYNSGTVAAGSFSVATAGVPSSTTFCYSLLNPTTGSPLANTCPTMSLYPATFSFPVALQPGTSVVAVLTLSGAPFVASDSYTLTVSTPVGAQQSLAVVALPA